MFLLTSRQGNLFFHPESPGFLVMDISGMQTEPGYYFCYHPAKRCIIFSYYFGNCDDNINKTITLTICLIWGPDIKTNDLKCSKKKKFFCSLFC